MIMEKNNFEAQNPNLGLPPIHEGGLMPPVDGVNMPNTLRSDNEVIRGALNAVNVHRVAGHQTIRQSRLNAARDMKRARQVAFNALVNRRTTHK